MSDQEEDAVGVIPGAGDIQTRASLSRAGAPPELPQVFHATVAGHRGC